MTNQEVIQKADIALSDLATAGKLNPEQTDRFIRTLIDQPDVARIGSHRRHGRAPDEDQQDRLRIAHPEARPSLPPRWTRPTGRSLTLVR